MIIYGTGEKKLTPIQNRKQKCPNCSEFGISFYFFQRYFHLFWVPTFPIGRRIVAACEKCSAIFQDNNIPVGFLNELNYLKNTPRIPLYLFSGLAVYITGIFLLFYFYFGITTYKYPTGQKEARGKMIHSEMDGKWKFWYGNGKIKSVQFYEKGVEDSL